VAFALPGAFTPTCSAAHLPRFNTLAPIFHRNGVDEILCFSVNDAFVMEAWKKSQKANRVRMVPDGNGEFAAKMGLLVDMRHLGYGHRSRRYSMLVRDKTIEKMFIEPDKEGDPYEVSDADTLLHHINPKATELPLVSLFTREGCPFCAKAKRLLEKNGMEYEEIRLGDSVTEQSLRAVTGASTVPQVFIDGKHIGSSEDLEEYLEKHPVG
jgi:glutaredoxin-like protein